MTKIYKAQQAGSKLVPDIHLTGTEPFPQVVSSAAASLHLSQGQKIFYALVHSLAGGTFDALFAEMARFKASQLVVPHRRIEARMEYDD
jgi:hypothetical protein